LPFSQSIPNSLTIYLPSSAPALLVKAAGLESAVSSQADVGDKWAYKVNYLREQAYRSEPFQTIHHYELYNVQGGPKWHIFVCLIT